MTDFIVYSTSIFQSVANSSTQILMTNTNTYYVNSINVCNTSANTITINLTKTILNTDNSTAFLVKNLEVPAASAGKSSTIDLIKYFGIEIFLPVTSKNNVLTGSSLNIYSGGINQVFDCIVDYSILTELPAITLQQFNR